MKNKTILFLPEGFNLSKALSRSLRKIFEQDMVIHHDSASIDINASYEHRKYSFYHAFLFIMRAVPLVPDSVPEVHKFLSSNLTESKPLDSKSLDAHKIALAVYLHGLVQAIQYYWGIYHSQAVEWLEKAEQYLLLERGRSNLATLSAYEVEHEKYLILQWDKQLAPCPFETIQELDQIRNFGDSEEMPEWYLMLPPYEKYFLNTILRDSDNLPLEEVFSFIPTGITAFPALSEFSEQHLSILNDAGDEVVRFPKRLTSGFPVTLDMEIQSGSSLENQNCLRNLRHISLQVEDAWSIQSLMNPMKNTKGYMPFTDDFFGSYLYLQLCKSLKDLKIEQPKREIYFTSHPLIPKTDHLDSIMPVYDRTGVDFEECSVFLEGMERYLAENLDNCGKLQQIKQLYKEIISPEKKATTASIYYSRPQWLLSLENVAFMQNKGVSYSIYEPGNGRKALHILHANTVMLYESFHRKWPSIDDSGQPREDFNNLFVHLFQTKHFQRLNELSAPGSLGVRNASQYLLPDILRTIYKTTDNSQLLAVENRLALNYHIDSCIDDKMPAWNSNYMPCLLKAIQLPADNRLAIVGHIKDLVKDESLWILKKRYNPSWWQESRESFCVDVENVRKILNGNASTVEILAKMYQLIKTHPEYLSRRTSTMHVISASLLPLYNFPNDETIISNSMNKLVEMKDQVSQFRVANSVHW